MTVAAGASSYSVEIPRGGAGIDCESGVHLVIGSTQPGRAGPVAIFHNVSSFSVETANRQTRATAFTGVVELGSAGATTIDRPSALRVEAGPRSLATDIQVSEDGTARVRVSGNDVSTVVSEHGGNQVPTLWQRSRSVSLPIVSALLTGAFASFVVLINIATDRFGRKNAAK
jgi:hypothetical protein